jgi:hypothetical protein
MQYLGYGKSPLRLLLDSVNFGVAAWCEAASMISKKPNANSPIAAMPSSTPPWA